MHIKFNVDNNKIRAKIFVHKENIFSYEVITDIQDSYADVYFQLKDNIDKAINDLKKFRQEISAKMNLETTFHKIP